MLPWLFTLSLFLPTPQQPSLPQNPQQRFLDLSDELDRRGLVAVVGTLDKLKEGKRERLEDGKLGNSTSNVSVSGTQYFKVAVTTQVVARAVLLGAGKDKLPLEFDLQVARLPDGKERRQAMTANAPQLQDGTLALWVLAPRDKGKGMEILHVVPFDPAQDKGDEAAFTDAMRDAVGCSQRLGALKKALADFEGARDAAAKSKARDALRALVEAKFETKRPELQVLADTRLAPYEKRARDRLAENE
jgi:hypothetical protein